MKSHETGSFPIGNGWKRASEQVNLRSDDDEDKAYVRVSRAELMRGHRPVVVSEVPVYVALEDREGRRFEDKGNCEYVRGSEAFEALERPSRRRFF